MKDLAAADQRTGYREKRIGSGCTDKRHDPVFHIGQQSILLSLVEAVDLVDEQQRLAAARGQTIPLSCSTLRKSFTPLVTALSCRN